MKTFPSDLVEVKISTSFRNNGGDAVACIVAFFVAGKALGMIIRAIEYLDIKEIPITKKIKIPFQSLIYKVYTIIVWNQATIQIYQRYPQLTLNAIIGIRYFYLDSV